MEKRVFLIVLDSFGIGAEPDAAAFGDAGTNTLGAIANHPNFNCPNLRKLGLFNIDGVTAGERTDAPAAAFARLQEQSMGKDTTIGHWEIAGVVSPEPPPISYVKVSGGIFLDMTVHDFDMARFIGGEVEEVYANAAVTVDPAIGEAGDVDTALVALKFKSGAIGVIDNCRKAAYGYDQRLEVFGSKGQASAANDTPTNVSFIDETGNMTDKPLYFFLERYMQSFTDEMTEFIDCVINDKPTKTTVYDGLEALRLGLAAKLSVAEHRPVKLSEIEA